MLRRRKGEQEPDRQLNPVESTLAISFSRDSDGKERRLEEWAEKKGITLHDREHRRNEWTASKHGVEIAGEVNSDECAAETGNRGEEVIATARQTGATVVLIPDLRRLGVGLGQVTVRQQLEAAGLTIISGKDSENRFLQCEPDLRRDMELWRIAGEDQYEWAKNKQRLAAAHHDHWATPAGQATLAFIADRPHLSRRKVAAALEFHRHRTATGNTNWHASGPSRPQTHRRPYRGRACTGPQSKGNIPLTPLYGARTRV